MEVIFNLTQHQPTPDQVQAGVTPVCEDALRHLNFESLPTQKQLSLKAWNLGLCADHNGLNPDGTYNFKKVMIGGAPYLMGLLEANLRMRGYTPVYAFSARVSQETQNPDGTTTKTMVFKHLGFVEGTIPYEVK